jgi:hypothetical protein
MAPGMARLYAVEAIASTAVVVLMAIDTATTASTCADAAGAVPTMTDPPPWPSPRDAGAGLAEPTRHTYPPPRLLRPPVLAWYRRRIHRRQER